MKSTDFFGSKYLNVTDIPPHPTICTVEGCMAETFDDDKGKETTKLVLVLSGFDKPAICNATNNSKLTEMWGDETDEWIGRQLKVVKARVFFRGRMVDSMQFIPSGKRAPRQQKAISPFDDTDEGEIPVDENQGDF